MYENMKQINKRIQLHVLVNHNMGLSKNKNYKNSIN